MQKLRLAFIDHSFHKKSRSGDFLRRIFSDHFEITDYWDESWQGGATVPPEEINKHDYAFYFQVLNPFHELERIRVPMLWAPMYDGIKFNYFYWKAISQFDIKILSFSKKITSWLTAFSNPVLPLQYYIPPTEIEQIQGNRVFFWYRGGITFNDIKRLIDPRQIDRFTLFENPDKEGQTFSISKEDIEGYKIERVVESFLPKERYSKLVRDSNIFIAPRKKEGIGMSFIEALAAGKCVIGYDDATLCEYVTHGIDGLLFTENTPRLDLSKTDAIRHAAAERYSIGYDRWLLERKAILPFLTAPYRAQTSHFSRSLWVFLYRVSAFKRKVRYYIFVKVPGKAKTLKKP
ncbi:MAG: glycosyltransferase [Candidatus Taylorbacteria bacterium]|nr:glycosyltransferase [Candidatus Taylorbacteria bacterium]